MDYFIENLLYTGYNKKVMLENFYKITRRFHMKINFLKKCAAAVLAVSVLSTGLIASAAEISPATPAPQVSDNSEWVFPTPADGQVPYDQYLGALLDVYYRNDPRAFVALGLGTEEEAASIYNEVLNSEVLSMELDSYFNAECPEDIKNDLQTLMAQMLGSARYAVAGCELQADGTYKVTLVYEKMIVFEPLMELYMAVVTDMAENWISYYASYPSDEELMIHIVAALRDSLRVTLENVTYAAPAITTVTFRPQGGVCLPDVNDIAKIESALFDTDYIMD